MHIRATILLAQSICLLALFGLPQQSTAPAPAPDPSAPAATAANPAAAQTPAATDVPATTAATTQVSAPSATAPAAATQAPIYVPPVSSFSAPPVASAPAKEPGITEEEVKHLLLGKSLFLRGFYLADDLNYNEHGKLVSKSPVGSFTLAAIEIEHVRLLKHKLELEGVRYALHYTGTLAAEGGQNAYDRIRITPKKKSVRITIDREELVLAKKKIGFHFHSKAAAPKPATPAVGTTAPLSATTPAPKAPAPEAAAAKEEDSDEPMTAEEAKAAAEEKSKAEAEVKAEKPEEKAADPNSVTKTLSPTHAAALLREAISKVFSNGIDDEFLASLPDFWKNYYLAAQEKREFIPSDPNVTRLNSTITPPKLLNHIEADSNDYAQHSEISGLAQYHVVLGADGTVKEIAASRPIGFGLDENAATAIRKAKFEPATKDGKAVPVLINITVPFRIYSKRTMASAPKPAPAEAPAAATPPTPPVPTERPTYK